MQMGTNIIPSVHQLAQCPIFIIRYRIRQFVQHINQHQGHGFRIITVTFLIHRHTFSLGVRQSSIYVFYMESFFNQPYSQGAAITAGVFQTIHCRLIFCHKTADLPYLPRKLRWFITKRNLSQLCIPAWPLCGFHYAGQSPHRWCFLFSDAILPSFPVSIRNCKSAGNLSW